MIPHILTTWVWIWKLLAEGVTLWLQIEHTPLLVVMQLWVTNMTLQTATEPTLSLSYTIARCKGKKRNHSKSAHISQRSFLYGEFSAKHDDTERWRTTDKGKRNERAQHQGGWRANLTVYNMFTMNVYLWRFSLVLLWFLQLCNFGVQMRGWYTS